MMLGLNRPVMTRTTRLNSPPPAHSFRTTRRALPARKYLIGGAALLVVLGGYWYFSKSGDEVGARGGNAAPVRVGRVERRDMAVVEHTLGTVVANTTVNVTSRVQGVVDSAAFREGQFVKKGDLLFQIDPRGFEAALAQ